MVKRFQNEGYRGRFDLASEPLYERPTSVGSMRRSRTQNRDGSDSDMAPAARPRLRRGRTEQPPTRQREISKPGLLSDGDRSYAANASRIPSMHGRRSIGGPGDTYRLTRTRALTAPSSPPRSRQTSPDLRPSAGPSRTGSPDNKPRILGKGKHPRTSEIASGVVRGGRRAFGSNRVSSIARHFDRLSEEAEKQRAKRNAVTRSRRARPVIATKAKVQVFNNVRDAFRDESDSDSSEADNEEDDLGSDESADSGQGRPRSSRKLSSPAKPGKPTPIQPIIKEQSALDLPVQSSTSMDTLSTSNSSAIPISASASSTNANSILSDTRSEMSFTDRLQIELPQFETSAPLPSVPATPQLSADAFEADEKKGKEMSQISQMSESELSSGGERSSILKTLTGLWAFRAGEFSPLEYPLCVSSGLID